MTLIRTHPKPVRYVDEDYLAFLRNQPCVVYGCARWTGNQPHHTISRGAGGSDLLALPVCAEHHTMMEAGQINDRDYAMDGWALLAEYVEAKGEM